MVGMAEKSSWDQANRRQKFGLVWRNRKKISQIIKYLPFNLLIILCLAPCIEASNAQSGPFALEVAGKQLVSYDDVESVRRKAEYVKAEGLAGASLSTLDLDDFNNLCCQVRGPLIFLHFKLQNSSTVFQLCAIEYCKSQNLEGRKILKKY
jgi:hypothetical protein